MADLQSKQLGQNKQHSLILSWTFSQTTCKLIMDFPIIYWKLENSVFLVQSFRTWCACRYIFLLTNQLHLTNKVAKNSVVAPFSCNHDKMEWMRETYNFLANTCCSHFSTSCATPEVDNEDFTMMFHMCETHCRTWQTKGTGLRIAVKRVTDKQPKGAFFLDYSGYFYSGIIYRIQYKLFKGPHYK